MLKNNDVIKEMDGWMDGWMEGRKEKETARK